MILSKGKRNIGKILNNIYCLIARLRLKNYDFTIISNDCWGGGVYEDLKLQYKTPIVGLFFYSPCYIDFLENFNRLIQLDLSFVKKSKYSLANNYRTQNNHYYPIAKLEEIEIHFLHYDSEELATVNWARRKSRINFDNLFFKFSDNNLCTQDLIDRFDRLPLSKNRKVFFTANKFKNIQSHVFLNYYKDKAYVGDIYSNRWSYRRNFDVIKWLNKK